MPKKPSMCMVMQSYPPFSMRQVYTLEIQAVRKVKAVVCFELAVLDDPRHAGRAVSHPLPAVLTPQSPLTCFLADGFGVRLSERQSIDLAQFVGRRFLARFDKGADGFLQTIVAVKRCDQPPGRSDEADTATDAEDPA